MSDIVPAILFGAKTIRGVFQISAVMTEAMARFFEEHEILPPIAKVYEWGEAKEAFEALVKQEGVGKIVVRVGERS
jgi:D-arabinose 1-dehydrogenase-like Zn-dependent alcohol dehydrogenase